ncbi:A/G-specific adenine glycosylase [Galbibacter sp. EGI 63066]|uniref:A/G-specific adenine glycosylase n=1 Tax=Galbibacter sp. EGI 63066 TaxID=2993559 RepID=UPI002248A290|nr:A/G-specific adenine glycosylase [Galbibacter sp. EGI 63066]MCX2681820.1 A/G-specific adenine glycosylase [Galbibacter sp. EGI 63066]
MDFSRVVRVWYDINKRDLPWRSTKDPYQIWLSEIMLQQTRVEQGLPYYLKFTERFPTVFDLANASEEEILKLWQGLGYYSRARNLHTTAKKVAFDLNGIFPDNYKELKELKGIGDYTASAIASICFDRPTPVVDGNVYRVFSRYFGIDIPINSTKGIQYFKKLAEQLIDVENPGEYNQAVMEFGARQCKPKSPNCDVCPLQHSCVAYSENRIVELPVKLKKGKVKQRYFNYLIVTDNQKTLLQQRTKKDIWQNLYEFPLVESSEEINIEKLKEHRVFLDLTEGASYDLTLYNEEAKVHKLSHQHIHTRFWIVTLHKKMKTGIERKDVPDYPVPVLIANFVEDFGF